MNHLMTLHYEDRPSSSPYIASVIRGHTTAADSVIRPAEVHWHMVFARHEGRVRALIAGPWTTAGVASWGADAEILWIKLALGTYMPHWPVRELLDRETPLPQAARNTFWLDGERWQLPDYENVETFIGRLVRQGILARDPAVPDLLHDPLPTMPPRTLRHRFRRATGLSQSHISQAERAQQALALLQQGASILDTVHTAGYFDQPHLTRALKRFTGYTPGQIAARAEAAA